MRPARRHPGRKGRLGPSAPTQASGVQAGPGPRWPTGGCAGPEPGFAFPLRVDPKAAVTVAAAHAVWRRRALGTRRGNRPRRAPGPPAPSPLPAPRSPPSPAQKACQPAPTFSLLFPPPRAGLRFPSINSRPNSIREGSFELLCLLGKMWAQEGSRYNFHFLKCLREHPGFLSPHQAGLGARVSGLVTQLSPNKRSSQSPGEGELPAIHDPWSR